MASYYSVIFLCVFLPSVIVVYNIVPKKHRWKVLLIGSYVFYWCFSGKLLIYLLFSTFSIHHIGIWLTNIQYEYKAVTSDCTKDERKNLKKEYENKKRNVMVFAVLLHIGILLLLKYTDFFGANVNILLKTLGISFSFNFPSFMLPLGISFYTLQALSYLFDVYRGKINADRNLGKLALYLSFFPQMMEGPICRYEETGNQLMQGENITYRNLTFGIQRILFGIMKKVVIADRLNLFIKNVFVDFNKYDGGVIAIAMVCYTCQLYMEFSGTMDVVIGTGEIFGIKMPENFRQPFFSKTISEFWTRWHITLGAWFRDYLFYPISMSKPLKKLTIKCRKRLGNNYGPLIPGTIALFTVWISNGLWHGSAWNYIFFGMYHFVLILTGNIFEPLLQCILKKLHINRTGWIYRGIQIIRTVILVNIGELFFRANGLYSGLYMFNKMITDFSIETVKNQEIFQIGMDKQDFFIVVITVLIIFICSILRENNINIRERLSGYNIVFRWITYLSLIMFIVIFGAYGTGYIPLDPIYGNF